MQNEVENFLASHAYSDATHAAYKRVLIELAQMDTAAWSTSRLLQFVKRDTWGNSWQCTALYACRKFLRWKHGNQHPALTAKIKRIKPKPQRSMNYDQVLQLLASFDTYTSIGARDQALLAIAIDTGFRVAELARIQLRDIDRAGRTIQCIVKGGQWGYGIYSPETAAIVERWLAYRTPRDGVNNLFISLKKGAHYGSALSVDGIKTIFKRWGKKCGFPLSPHDARRTFARLSTRNGAPTRLLQIAGRWHDIKQVERYTQGIEAAAITPYLPMHNTPK